MDAQGNIALAYTIVSNTQYPSLRYTGRYSTDPLNVMTIAEESIAEGSVSDPSFRYGDYSQMTIDPADGITFWSIGEYFNGGPRKNHVGVFRIAAELANDVGIVGIDQPDNGILSSDEEITITIRNFGIDTQTDVPVYYQIDEGPLIEEIYSGSIPSNVDVSYTFTSTADLSVQGQAYHINAGTNLAADQNNVNDTVSKLVMHLYNADLGVTEITSPTSGSYLSDEEAVSVTIENFGADDQDDFDVLYILNDGTPVSEQVSGTIEAGTSMFYTFMNTVDLSEIGDHELVVATSLTGDQNSDNDFTADTITNSLCQPELMCDQGVGFFELTLGDIYTVSGCNENGYADYTDLSTDIEQGSTNDLIVKTEYGSVFVKVWIDFNDNFLFETDEIVVEDFEIAPGQTNGTFTETIPLVIPGNAPLGEHLMRAKCNYDEIVPLDPCEQTLFGEVEDYTVNITLGTAIAGQINENSELIFTETSNNNFKVTFRSQNIDETLIITVHNIQGQTLIRNRVPNMEGLYEFDFDMSHAPSGIYLLRLGSDTFGKVKKFVVR